MPALPEKQTYSMKDIEALPEGVRAELIGGQLFYMAAPSIIHQEILTSLVTDINSYIKANNGKCKVFPAP